MSLLHVTAMASRALAPTIRVVCCQCRRQYGTKPCPPEQDGQVSHGLCGPECKAKMLAGAK